MAEEATKSRRMFPREGKPSLWRRFKWKADAVWTFVRNIPDNIKMICQWIPVLWSNWDWDYNFFLTIIQYKLRRMSKHIGEHDILVNSQRYAKQMAFCADIIDRLFKDEYTTEEEKAHEEKWGELIMDSYPAKDYPGCHTLDIYRVKAREQGREEEEREETMQLHNLARARREKDLDILFRVMRKNIERWWD
jgi:hypothetical protein